MHAPLLHSSRITPCRTLCNKAVVMGHRDSALGPFLGIMSSTSSHRIQRSCYHAPICNTFLERSPLACTDDPPIVSALLTQSVHHPPYLHHVAIRKASPARLPYGARRWSAYYQHFISTISAVSPSLHCVAVCNVLPERLLHGAHKQSVHHHSSLVAGKITTRRA